MEYAIISLQDLNDKFKDGDEVNVDMLVKAGLINNKNLPVKVLANGTIKIKLILKINAISKPAKVAIERVGGKVEVV